MEQHKGLGDIHDAGLPQRVLREYIETNAGHNNRLTLLIWKKEEKRSKLTQFLKTMTNISHPVPL